MSLEESLHTSGKVSNSSRKLLTHLKPADESALEHTIGYEQLAVDLTAHLAKRVNDEKY